MKVERIVPLPLTKEQALACAVRAAQEQLHVRAEGAKYLGGGSFGRAVGLTLPGGKKIVVKLLRAKDMMEKEAHDLRLLREHCPVRMPAVLFERRAGGEIPADCYGMEHIEGKNALFALGMLLQGKRKRLAFAEEVTAALHAVHGCRHEKFGDTMRPDCDTWLQYYRPFAEQVLEKAEDLYVEEKISGKIVGAMRAAWKKFDVIFSEPVKEACLIHGDLNIANIMVGRGGKVTGFIDPLNSMYADREYDLFQFNNLTGKRFLLCDTYTANYGASALCAHKLAFYGLWNEVFCYIKSGVLVGLIMDPLVKNMLKRAAEL